MWWELVVVSSVFRRPCCAVPGDDGPPLVAEEKFSVAVRRPNDKEEMARAMAKVTAQAERFLVRVKADLVVHNVVTVYALEVL